VPGCPRLAYGKWAQCDEHRAEADKRKGTRSERGYDNAWLRTSRRFLRIHQWCQWPGCISRSTQTDHIDGDVSNCEPWNLRALCTFHHAQRTARDQPGGARG
jgi:5-methylcytosine-specific restriction enzyme A